MGILNDKPAHRVVRRLWRETGSRGAWPLAAKGVQLLLGESGLKPVKAFPD